MAHALKTSITLHADKEITPSNSELITFGLPLAKGEVTALSAIKAFIAGEEVPVYVEAGLRYHWLDNSLRSVTIQLQNVDMTAGDVVVTVTNEGHVLPRLAKLPPAKGWTKSGSNKNNLPYPRIFALHDKFYLAESGLIPPYLPSPETGDAFDQFQLAQFNNHFGNLDFSKSRGSDWLFDRSSAMFKAYMSSGRVEFLKEAFLSKQFYFQYVRNDGKSPRQAGGDGCWTYGGVACADGKYIAPQQAKLAWALFGDNSQWDNDLIIKMALQADLGWNQYASRDPFDKENEGFTERGAGLAGLAELIAYEMTADYSMLSHLNQRITSLQDMQQTEKSWDIKHGWIPKSGGFTHNIDVHEGNYNESSAPHGATNSRGFSVWMSENIVDFLWQTYWVTGNKNIPKMLSFLAEAIEKHGFTTSYDASTQTYTRKSGYTGYNKTKSCNSEGASTDLLYMASAYADQATRIKDDWWPYYSDTHNIETVLSLSAGLFFHHDNATRAALRSRIDRMIKGWVNLDCAKVFSNIYRLFNWQHRSNSVRTWAWVAQQSNFDFLLPTMSYQLNSSNALSALTASDAKGTGPREVQGKTLSEVVRLDDIESLVFVAQASCKEGDDPHWQCSAKWTEYSQLKITDFIAVCPKKEAEDYGACLKDDMFIPLASLDKSDGLFICKEFSAVNKARSACSYVEYVATKNLQ